VRNRAFALHRCVPAAALATLLLGLSAALPLMDASRRDEKSPVLESAHDEATCAHGHDHGICAQVGANAGIATEPGRHGLIDPQWREAALAAGQDAPTLRDHTRPLGPRAPPLA
jgi:hypothetical protein